MVKASDLQAKAKASLGKGIAYPFHFNDRGRVATSDGVVHVSQGVKQSILTAFEERVMVRRFGSRIRRFLFHQDFQLLQQEIRADIQRILSRWEKRVRLVSVRVEQEPEKPEQINVEVSYLIIRTNELGTEIFPFYVRNAG